MLDLSPEKLMVLLTIGLLVLGPQKLPLAARTLAEGLAKVKRLANCLTEPVNSALAEPRQLLDETIGDLRKTINSHTPSSSPSPPTDPTPG